jgi:hypothetical protein
MGMRPPPCPFGTIGIFRQSFRVAKINHIVELLLLCPPLQLVPDEIIAWDAYYYYEIVEEELSTVMR